MAESIDARDSELNGTAGTHAKAFHVGLNHYFNSNVRLMIDAARGVYIGGHSDFVQRETQRHVATSAQARLHFKL